MKLPTYPSTADRIFVACCCVAMAMMVWILAGDLGLT
jgi:hypothetical protein